MNSANALRPPRCGGDQDRRPVRRPSVRTARTTPRFGPRWPSLGDHRGRVPVRGAIRPRAHPRPGRDPTASAPRPWSRSGG